MSTLSCETIRERITDGDEDVALHAHAKDCAQCRPILTALDAIDAQLAELPAIDAPDALVEQTLARVKAEDETVGSPSLLLAALAMLTSALFALAFAPLTLLRWLLGVGSAGDAATRSTSIEDRGKTPERSPGARRGVVLAPVFALGSLIVGIVAFSTFRFANVSGKMRTRGAETVANELPRVEGDTDGEAGDDWWGGSEESGEVRGRGLAHEALPSAREAVARREAQVGDQAEVQLRARPGGYDQPNDPSLFAQGIAAPGTPTTTPSLDGLDLVPSQRIVHGHAAGAFDVTDSLVRGGERDDRGLAEGNTVSDETVAPTHHTLPVTAAPAPSRSMLDGRDGVEDVPRGPTGTTRTPEAVERSPIRSLDDTGDVAEDRDGFDDFETDLEEQTQRALTPWDLAQSTTGLTFRSSQSWWANTYVPGDARLRVLHSRLAASATPLPGTTTSALALAESASPTVPAVAAPIDRALAIGVHADTTAIEGPTRVRVEIALRAIDQAAGRRGALRIALVVDARSMLGDAETTHLRSLLAALSHSLTPRDRVILTAAGARGGTLVPLGVLRHGQVEVALRHLADVTSAGESIPTSLDEALAAGLEAVATTDDGAGLVLLVTPDGSHDASVDQALHLGAVAGVATTAVGIGTSASTSSLDAIALAGEGRRRLVLSDDDAIRTVREELTAAARLVARALRVRVRLADGVQLIDVIGSHALDTEETRRTRESERAIDRELARRLGIGQDRDDDDSGVRILVPSFYSGDSHTIVLDLLVSRPGPVADVDVRFKDLVRLGNGTASAALRLQAGTAPRGPHELRVVASFVGHDVASALDEAADALERGDASGARARLTTAHALLDQARASVDGLASVPSIAADRTLLDHFVAALDLVLAGASDPPLVAASLHYAAARRIVVPQLAGP